jgi:prepilin-type N-terminal cleavage/methylation domain-containing protein
MNRSVARRRGFTLIELLVVVVIIAVLAALISAAVAGAIGRAKEARITMELQNISGAMELYKAKHGSYPPNTPNELRSHIQARFPRAKQEDLNTLPNIMDAAEILWFCLRGYTSDPQRPVDFFNDNAKRDGEFEFDQGRLVRGDQWDHVSGGQRSMTPLDSQRTSPKFLYSYVPQEGKDRPYVYFDCSRGDRPNGLYGHAARAYGASTGNMARPYRMDPSNPDPQKRYRVVNEGKFQIISAGLDGEYGSDVSQPNDKTTHKIFPEGDRYTDGDKDNLTNFTERNLQNSIP